MVRELVSGLAIVLAAACSSTTSFDDQAEELLAADIGWSQSAPDLDRFMESFA